MVSPVGQFYAEISGDACYAEFSLFVGFTNVVHSSFMRIVSLLPSATEILFALGFDREIVGVSHECDFPPNARTRTVVIHSRMPHDDGLTGNHLFGGGQHFRIDRLKRVEPIVRRCHDHETQEESSQIVLLIQTSIYRDENVKMLFGECQQRRVLCRPPPRLTHGLNSVPRERVFHARRYTFV